jgi:hypothetical protein
MTFLRAARDEIPPHEELGERDWQIIFQRLLYHCMETGSRSLSYTLRRTFHFDLAFFCPPGWGGGGCPMHGKYGGLYRVTVGISEYEQEGIDNDAFLPTYWLAF